MSRGFWRVFCGGITKCALNCQFYLYKFCAIIWLVSPGFPGPTTSVSIYEICKICSLLLVVAKYIHTLRSRSNNGWRKKRSQLFQDIYIYIFLFSGGKMAGTGLSCDWHFNMFLAMENCCLACIRLDSQLGSVT